MSLFTRRLLFVPAQLTFKYFEYFNMNQFVWWSSNNIIGLFIQYPYEKPFPQLIGEDYLNTPLLSANNGFFSTGFMHGGIVGIFIYFTGCLY